MKKFFIFLIAVMLMGNAVTAFAHEENILERIDETGKVTLQQLKSGTVQCKNLTDEDFYMVGKYFMDQMMGGAHANMNAMMKQIMGEEGENGMHAVMGKRMSGCDPLAEYSTQTAKMMPIMNMMSMMGSNWNGGMMGGNFSGTHWISWIWMFLWWAVPLLAVGALLKWILKK